MSAQRSPPEAVVGYIGGMGSAAVPTPSSGLTKPVKRIPRKLKSSGPEWLLQAAMVSEFHKLEGEGWQLTVAADMGAAKRSFAEAAKCKAMGLTAGEPDVRVYFPGGKLVSIECKVDEKQPSEVQLKRHGRLRALGFDVFTQNLFDEEQARACARSYAKLFSKQVLS